MELKQLFTQFTKSIQSAYDQEEARSIGFIVFENLFSVTRSDILTDKFKELDQQDLRKLEEWTIRLQNHEPVQYITGETVFYGLPFFVDPAVLIPRPETEELVDLILKENDKTSVLNILDIGTGSGCIAISLSKSLPHSHVRAIDISTAALEVASKNNQRNKTNVEFSEFDILTLSEKNPFDVQYDIIVSNPPYIAIEEKELMRQNVLDFEPHLALFAEGDPLIFYKTIARFSTRYLKKGGKVYLEINERYGQEVKQAFKAKGFRLAEVIKDISNKDRIVKIVF